MKTKHCIDMVGATDVGRVRDHNEDYIAWDRKLGLVVLADGMGGHNAGEVASQMAVEGIISQMKQSLASLDNKSQNESIDGNAVCMSMESISTANSKIFEAAALHPEYAGMGTTLVMALFHDDNVTIAHVGDSRMYRFRNAKLEQLTVDHSLLQEMVQNGYMSEDEATKSLNKNMITRALGINIDVEIDIQQQILEVGDILLLCSDGLSDFTSEDDIQTILQKPGNDLNEKSVQLVDKANENGGHDNISVVIIKVMASFEKNGICS